MAAETSRKSEEKARQLHAVRRAFDGQKAIIAEHAAKQAAAVVVQVIAGVLTGGVGLKPDGAGWFIRDEVLRRQVQALQLGEALRDVVALVSGLWDRLKARLSAADLSGERQGAVELVRKFDVPPPPTRSGGFEP